ncbi:MAG: hypothetical protein Q9166_000265 [cf. Caloplaca sp. 2 TL-2023]
MQLRVQLLRWENSGGRGIPLPSIDRAPDATKQLHNLYRNFRILLSDLDDFDDDLAFYIELGKKCKSMTPADLGLVNTAVETMLHAKSRTRMCRRWAENYHERARLMMMSPFFSIGSQVDSRTNLDVANLTSRIAGDAQPDSSSMITIAAVTMVFLPGTFISAVFSMAFFNAGRDEHGKATLEVSPLVWYFPAITIPLTILVFCVWEVWRRKRQAKAITTKSPSRERGTELRLDKLRPASAARQLGTATKIEFLNLLPGDIAAVWERPGEVHRPANGNDCSRRVLQTGHGPGQYSFTPTESAHQPGGGSYISVGQMKLPPDKSTASALLVEGIFGLVWGGGQWFGSAAARRKYGGGLKSKVRRGIVPEKKGTVYAQRPPRWVYPDVINVNGTEYAKVRGQDLIYKDRDGIVLDLTTMAPEPT